MTVSTRQRVQGDAARGAGVTGLTDEVDPVTLSATGTCVLPVQKP